MNKFLKSAIVLPLVFSTFLYAEDVNSNNIILDKEPIVNSIQDLENIEKQKVLEEEKHFKISRKLYKKQKKKQKLKQELKPKRKIKLMRLNSQNHEIDTKA